jgi:hypothetical protein
MNAMNFGSHPRLDFMVKLINMIFVIIISQGKRKQHERQVQYEEMKRAHIGLTKIIDKEECLCRKVGKKITQEKTKVFVWLL